MTFVGEPALVDPLRTAIRETHLGHEAGCVEVLAAETRFTPSKRDQIGHSAYLLVERAKSSDVLHVGSMHFCSVLRLNVC